MLNFLRKYLYDSKPFEYVIIENDKKHKSKNEDD